ncbi:hypothetical protein Tco_0432158 [Tanacetum coccineum]
MRHESESLSQSEEVPTLLVEQTEFLTTVTSHKHQELLEQLADQLELGHEQEELAALGQEVTRFKSTKKERAKIDIDLTYEKNSPWVGKALRDYVHVVSAAIDGTTPLTNSGIKNGMVEGNMGTISSSIVTTDPNTGSVPINVTDSATSDLNNTGPIHSGPASYAKLVIGERSTKIVNFRILITPAGN